MLKLLSCFCGLFNHAALSSYGRGNSVRMKNSRARRAIKELVAKSGRSPDEFSLHSLRIGGATTLGVGGDIPDRVMQRQGRWKSDAHTSYMRKNITDLRRVSRKVVVASEGKERQPGEETAGVRK